MNCNCYTLVKALLSVQLCSVKRGTPTILITFPFLPISSFFLNGIRHVGGVLILVRLTSTMYIIDESSTIIHDMRLHI